jgi:hypothetical protein
VGMHLYRASGSSSSSHSTSSSSHSISSSSSSMATTHIMPCRGLLRAGAVAIELIAGGHPAAAAEAPGLGSRRGNMLCLVDDRLGQG